LILSPLNVATPELALTVVVPPRVPPLGFVPIATVIDAADEMTVLPRLSWTVTVGGPPIALPALAFAGCVVKARTLADPGLVVNTALSPAVKLSPLVRVAVSTTPLSALVYVTPVIVT